jgi:hypothetical protein
MHRRVADLHGLEGRLDLPGPLRQHARVVLGDTSLHLAPGCVIVKGRQGARGIDRRTVIADQAAQQRLRLGADRVRHRDPPRFNLDITCVHLDSVVRGAWKHDAARVALPMGRRVNHLAARSCARIAVRMVLGT